MIVINGMPITDNLVDFLKRSYESTNPEFTETYFDNDVDSMMELNDYLIDILTMVELDKTDEVRVLSNHLINIKSAKDRMKQLSTLLKECREEGAQS